MSSNKLLFCILDADYLVASRNQHQTINSFCDQRGFSKGFYGTEDQSTIEELLYFESKINTLDQKYEGIVIFSIHQYKACTKFFILVKALVKKGKVFCAASEDIAITSECEFDDFFDFATVSAISLNNRDRWQDFKVQTGNSFILPP